jgi:hypothetical protein
MKARIIHLNRIMQRGERFTIIQGNKVLQLVVLAVEHAPQGSKNAYWVAQCLK